jgi:hypothetical protein
VTGWPFTPAIDGGVVGFDINPTDDRIRLVTDNDQNLRIHPLSGQVVAIDKNLTPSQVSINSIAYALSLPEDYLRHLIYLISTWQQEICSGKQEIQAHFN